MPTKRLDNPFYQLATLLDAGLTPAKAVVQISPNDSAWQQAHASVERGTSLHKALYDANLIQRFDSLLLQIGDTAGRLPLSLKELANQYDQRATMVQKIKAKLMLPFAVLLIAIFVSALLGIVANNESIGFALAIAAVQLVIPVFLLNKLFNFLRSDVAHKLNALAPLKNFTFYSDLFQQTVFSALAWQLESGIDIKRAWLNTINLLPSNIYRSDILTIASKCEQGNSMSSALSESKLPINGIWIQVIATAEMSGSLVRSIQHQLTLQRQEINNRIDTFTEWLPRLIYFLIVIKAIQVIL